MSEKQKDRRTYQFEVKIVVKVVNGYAEVSEFTGKFNRKRRSATTMVRSFFTPGMLHVGPEGLGFTPTDATITDDTPREISKEAYTEPAEISPQTVKEPKGFSFNGLPRQNIPVPSYKRR